MSIPQVVIHVASNTPPGKLADAELHFADGPLAGLKLAGFAVWRWRTAPVIADVNDVRGETARANAHLIAAAPELLAALKRAIEIIRVFHGLSVYPKSKRDAWRLYQQSPEMQAINAVIAKAEARP